MTYTHNRKPMPTTTHSTTPLHPPQRPLLQLLYQPYKYLIFLPILLLSTAILGSLIVLLVSLGLSAPARRVPVLWARLNAWATLSRVQVDGAELIQPGQSYVVVANHQSQFDILALYGWLDIDFRWVMKQELRRIPVLGLACEKLGHVFVDRGNARNASQSIEQVKLQISNGTCILFFPEGTRSRDTQLLPFKKGAFKLAKDLELPLLPITINGSGRILPTRSVNLMPGKASIRIHPPLEVNAEVSEKDLLGKAREIIESGLRE